VHWAHREREDGRHSPVEVLDWVHGRQVPPDELHRIFYATRFGRTLNRFGYVRFRHWRLYGERGLAGDEAVVWLYREQLMVAFADEALAHYQVTYQPDDRHLASVTAAELMETPYRSLQPPLWAWGADEWLAVVRVAPYASRQPRRPAAGMQPRLFSDEDFAAATG
jgi:putative transposase